MLDTGSKDLPLLLQVPGLVARLKGLRNFMFRLLRMTLSRCFGILCFADLLTAAAVSQPFFQVPGKNHS